MKSLYSLLALLLCFAATAFGTPMPNQLSSRATCSSSTMTSAIAALQDGVQYPHEFCSWYRSVGRTRSPLNVKGMTASVLENAYKCLGYSAPTSTPKATTTMTPGAVTNKCPAANIALLESRYKDTTFFCEFFNAAPRETSPLHVLGVKGVWNACNCILGKASTSSSASGSPVSSVTNFTSRTTGTTTPAITTSSLSSSMSGSPYTVSKSSTAIRSSTSISSITSSTSSSTTTSTIASTTFIDPYPIATMGYPASNGYNLYWGFSGTPAVESALEISSTSIGDQEFSWTNDDFTTGNVGYMVYADTGIRLTLSSSISGGDGESDGVDGESDGVDGEYDGSEVQLQTCDTTTSPSSTQTWELVYIPSDGTYAFAISADVQYFSCGPSQGVQCVTVSTDGAFFALTY